jgi:hypothetical protein
MKKFVLVAFAMTTMLFAQSGVKPVDNKLYTKECGSCHFDYQPGLLPKKSWVKMMSNLENHFGTDAFLAKENRDLILNYLSENSSDNAMEYKRSRRMTNSIWYNDTPLKITEVPYFIDKHEEVPKRLISQKEVKTISNCMACHRTAQRGSYSERDIKIPNYGRWDD